jgi:hypothetical protein
VAVHRQVRASPAHVENARSFPWMQAAAIPARS